MGERVAVPQGPLRAAASANTGHLRTCLLQEPRSLEKSSI
jgi:hypothetical protein